MQLPSSIDAERMPNEAVDGTQRMFLSKRKQKLKRQSDQWKLNKLQIASSQLEAGLN